MKRQVLFLIISLLIFLSLVSCVTVNAYTEDTTATDLVEMKNGDNEPFIISEVKDYANEYYINTRFVKDDLSVKIKAITEYKDSNLRIIR